MSDWVKAREFSTRFEAELARARIESEDIPAVIKSHEAGIFGPGFQGVVPSGVELHVPSSCLREVEALLDENTDAQADGGAE